MEWKFWHVAGPKRVPEKVGDALVSRFHLKPADIDNWRLAEKPGQLAALTGVIAEDRRVRFIRVFDPALVSEGCLADLTYDDLKTPEGRKALMFEGHIEKDGTVHLADRRPPRITKPIKMDLSTATATGRS